MDYRSIEKRLQAAHTILQADTINRSTFDSLKTLLSGINPKIDKLLASTSKVFKHADQLRKGDIIELTLEAWPEVTPEDKKRKKAMLLFFKFWNDLKAEVSRVEKEFAKSHQSGQGSAGAWGNILGAAKGPLGIITLIAIGIVALRMTEVAIVIQNRGCQPIFPVTSVAVNIPGLKLPSEIIPDGGQAIAKMPPLSLAVDATSSSLVRLQMYGITYDFVLGSSGIRLVFDGKTLNGKTTSIDLASQKEHSLAILCE